MNQWPDGWTDSSRGREGRGSGTPRPDPTRVMPHTSAPGVPPQTRGPGQGSHYGQNYDPGRDPRDGQGYDQPPPGSYDSGYSDGQVYGGGGGRGADRGPAGYDGRPRPDWRRRFKWGLITLVVVVLAWSVGTYFWADSKLRREVDLSIVEKRPEGGDGTNYLIVGSDSREGMTAEDRKKLHTGGPTDGGRTDSIMILHVGDNGSTMVSLPRDSDVEVPSYVGSESGKHYPAQHRHTKINATYAEDGPPLLVRTVEHNTGLKIDHYAEIGFGGFAKIVDAVGGVEMDIPQDIHDDKSGADFKKGKQTLDGREALAFVRTRYALKGSDLDRTKNQQKFLAALANQAATPGTVLNPLKLYPTMGAGLDTLKVDKDMSLWNVASMFWAMKDVSSGEGKSMNMPISGNAPGGNLQWDKAKMRKLVDQLNNDEKVTVTSDR
ncbi:LCP family protein [Streptomyces tubbatahanensis]|uniref:LCP family protein n=1 Tax=Streptomyces tubbatahanensis TaxID=2923272 RepID=A0ABY3XSB9_9ACTN|nr:LCP family protein [Streptomyces tubbatahanensis]UNS97376.1 LCP family protein [Streptomyces tubbatahanensis]